MMSSQHRDRCGKRANFCGRRTYGDDGAHRCFSFAKRAQSASGQASQNGKATVAFLLIYIYTYVIAFAPSMSYIPWCVMY
jgi:hypothetical protein